MAINILWLPILLASTIISGCAVTTEQPFPFDNPFLANMRGAEKQHLYAIDDNRCLVYANDGIRRKEPTAVGQPRRTQQSKTAAERLAGNRGNTSEHARPTSRNGGSDPAIFSRDQLYSGCMADRGWYRVDIDLGN